MEVLGDFLYGGHDVAHVRVFGLAQRRGNADVDRVQFAHHGEVGGRCEAFGCDKSRYLGVSNILHMGLATVQAHDL